MNPVITDEILCEKMKKIEDEIINDGKKDEEILVFFDEMNAY